MWETIRGEAEVDGDEEDDEQAAEKDADTFSEFTDFLEKRLRVISSVFAGNKTDSTSTTKPPRNRTASLITTSTVSPRSSTGAAAAGTAPPTPHPCLCCDKAHPLYMCDVFKSLGIVDRYQKVRDAKLCVNCFSNSHWAKDCKSIRCKECSRLHHTLLHPPRTTNSVQGTPPPPPQTTTTAPVTSTTTTTTTAASIVTAVANRARDVLLSTALVHASSNEQVCEIHALLDGASHVTLITSELARTLNLKLSHSTTAISGLGGHLSAAVATTSIRIAARDGSFSRMLHATVVNHVTDPLPATSFEIPSSWSFTQQYNLANPSFNVSRSIDMLIGADYLYDIVLPEMVKKPSLPTLLASRLGWLATGPYSASSNSTNLRCLKVTVASNELRAISSFLGLDDVVHPKEQLTADEVACEEIFVKTHQRDETGRFVLDLPRRPGVALGESRHLAIARLKRARIDDKYNEFMREYEALGHMSKCAPPAPGEETYYIPHHAVYHNGKIRVVFDASMKSSNGVSLNDCLFIGPTVQPKLEIILLRFRMHRYALVGDIEMMYRQILCAVKDRKFQRIVFFVDGEIIDYELNTITYGTSSAPFEATRTLNRIAEDGASEFPLASAALLDNTYMDDCLSGADTKEEAQRLRTELIELVQTAGMKFSASKWLLNEPTLLNPTDRSSSTSLNLHCGRTLGVAWNTNRDTFSFPSLATLAWTGDTLTRCSALSCISRIFDPIGLLAPLTVGGKLLIQELWSEQIQWDDAVEPEFQIRFEGFLKDAASAAAIEFERYLGTGDYKQGHFELHGFGDASRQAYAACIYIKGTYDGKTVTRLLVSKTRLAPKTSPRTIPQLELCAADLLVQLLKGVTTELNYPISKCFVYTDSSIVISYLAKPAGHWKPFVANRVQRITDLIPPAQWRHVPGDQNPADLATRSDSFATFLQRPELWQYGPEFLQNVEGSSITSPLFDERALSDARVSVNVVVAVDTVQTEQPDFVSRVITHCSEYVRARSIIASMLRVRDFLLTRVRKTTPQSGHFTAKELTRAELELLRAAQRDTYAKELAQLVANQPLPRKSQLKSLSPFLEHELLRVGGRISRADLPYERQHPVILPASHRLTLLLIRNCHHRFFHAGTQFIETQLRRHFWIVGPLLPRIQKCIRTCARCARFRQNAQRTPIMSDLPSARVRPSAPFSHVGIDYAGPFKRRSDIRTRSQTELKTYVAVFVCFCTRAVHLESVSDLSTKAFLAALQRFVSRRGIPTNIYSDNGTNFVGAANKLHEEFQRLAKEPQIHSYVSDLRINWTFNPPAAPHMGGLWEAAVRVMKFHLYRVIGETALNVEEFSTVLCQIEAIMNSCPITPTSSSSQDLEVLTPGHFLVYRPLTALPDNITDSDLRPSQRWDLLTHLRNSFWHRWSAEYLQSLQKRVKWTNPTRSYNVGDIVLLKETTTPLTWPLARIIQVYPGADGIVRSVDVFTRGGTTYRRPVVKLIPLVDVDEANFDAATDTDVDGGGIVNGHDDDDAAAPSVTHTSP
ncbi:uncharacterized protein LOC135847089 [Planococcus citri]|uniref:uncharacterized protein LOC135847089 n=1 Tax=Planococcus citri TaxID=170843 RepID=UPI0031F87638